MSAASMSVHSEVERPACQELEDLFHSALSTGEIHDVETILKAIAVHYPTRAGQLLDALLVSLDACRTTSSEVPK